MFKKEKVWVVAEFNWSEFWRVCAVFDTKEKAENYAKSQPQRDGTGYSIEEFKINKEQEG